MTLPTTVTSSYPQQNPGGKVSAIASSPADKPTGSSPNPACSLPYPKSLVADFAKVIDKEATDKLERKLEKLKKQGKIDFVVATTKTTGDQPIFDYSLALARCWGIGASNPDKAGLLLLIAVDDRKWRIQISSKLEEVLSNDELLQWSGVLAESFRASRYGEGLIKYVDKIIEALEERRGFSKGEA